MGRFFALDTMAILYRSHFAMIRNPLINSKGINVSGLNGLLHTLIRIIESEQPDYLAVVSDGPQATFRHERYPDYKATREKMPAELVEQLPYIPRIVEALQLPYLIIPGFEADDIIGTLVQEAHKRKLESFMVTGDKDFMQLINERTVMYAAKGDEVVLTKAEGVMDKFGCKPNQVVEVLALMGDSSDNVPGVRGVGVKTATKLIQDYGGLENIYAHLDEIKGKKLHENLANGREMAFLSRELVTIRLDVPLGVEFDSLSVHPAALSENQRLIDLLTELEFQGMRDRLLKKSGAPAAPVQPESVRYHTLDSLEAIAAVLPRWEKAGMLIFDTETTGLDYFSDKIIGLSFAVEAEEAWYIPLNSPALSGERQRVLQLLKPLLENPDLPKGGHNMKFDVHMLLGEEIEVEGAAHDTMISSHLSEPAERRHDLDSVALRRLGFTKIPTSDLIGKGKDQITMDQVPVETVSHYACEDADITYRLFKAFSPRLEQTSQREVFDTLEMPLMPVLVLLERAGIRFDKEGAQAISAEMELKLETTRAQIYELAGEKEFNINSIPDLQRVLYEKLRLHEELKVRPKKIKTGIGLSTDEETLEKMQAHPLPRLLLNYRELTKLKSTYLDQLAGFINPVTGKIHSSFRQTVAATGRLASDNPNLQNIPVRSEEGRKVRALFLPSDEEHVLLSADYSQIELRVVADYSDDPTFLQAFRTDTDIHDLTSAAIFGVAPGKVEREMRSVAKEVNFGLIYRMGADRLAQVTNRTRDEAREFIARFFEKYQSVRALQDELMDKARKEGYAETKLGRRRYLPEINSNNGFAARISEGMAINTPIQGTAAEIIKLAMISLDRRLNEEGLRSKMVLTIHDELLFDARRDEVELLQKLAREEMENAMELKVPLKVEMGLGENWLEAH
ncbi:MAG: DNA polymerase I [SAR324 cluster bacterium]|nr:DNA polymerase I [SAR324 cluster bacterium]